MGAAAAFGAAAFLADAFLAGAAVPLPEAALLPWARRARAALADCAGTARRARAAGLGVNAGHDLSQANLGAFLAAVPGVEEVSIGHALVGEALYAGLEATIRGYLAILDRTGPAASATHS